MSGFISRLWGSCWTSPPTVFPGTAVAAWNVNPRDLQKKDDRGVLWTDVFFFFFLDVYLFVCLFVCLCIYLLICLFVCLFINLSIDSSIDSSIDLLICLFIPQQLKALGSQPN